MIDPTDARSKAEASRRLAELAKTPRARELFKQLAEEYESRARGELEAGLIQQAEAAPSLVPVASMVSVDVPAPDEPPAPVVSLVAAIPLAPAGPLSESAEWLANLAAVRAES